MEKGEAYPLVMLRALVRQRCSAALRSCCLRLRATLNACLIHLSSKANSGKHGAFW